MRRGVAVAASLLMAGCSSGAAVEGGAAATTPGGSPSPSAVAVRAEHPALDCPDGSRPIGVDDAWEAIVPPATAPAAVLEQADTRWFHLRADDRLLQGPTAEDVRWVAIQRDDGAGGCQLLCVSAWPE